MTQTQIFDLEPQFYTPIALIKPTIVKKNFFTFFFSSVQEIDWYFAQIYVNNLFNFIVPLYPGIHKEYKMSVK